MSKNYLFNIDDFGIDPLSSDFYDVIAKVQNYSNYTIPNAEHLNPALTSYKVYKEKNWWPFILAYNQLGDLWDYTEGSIIKIPDINELTTLIQRSLTTVVKETTVTL